MLFLIVKKSASPMRLAVLVFFLLNCVEAFSQDYHNKKVDPEKVDCHVLPDTFATMKDAVQALEGSTFRFTQQFKTGKPEGVMAAKFYSCDNETGYLALKVDGKYVIYLHVPRKRWVELTQSDNLDEYYQKNLAGKFKISVKE